MSQRTRNLMMAALMTGLVACGGGSEEKKPDGTAPAAGGDTAAASLPDTKTGTASIKGVAKVTGTAPADSTIEPADMGADPVCAKAHATTVKLNEYVIDANGGVADVFVYVKEGAPASKPSAEQVKLDQAGCLYQPKVFGVQVGQKLHIINSDETSHNVNMQATKNRKFNRGLATKGATYDHTFQKPEVLVQFKCDIHPWMYGYGGVSENPFFTVSGADGSFEIKNLPAGDYTIEAVHAKLGTQTSQKVTVADGEAKAGVDFAFAAGS